jgi:hypothetical protein
LIGCRRLWPVAVGAAGYVIAVGAYGSAGTGPPGRFYVLVVPLLAVPTAAVLARARDGALALVAVLAAWSMATVWISADAFQLMYGPDIEWTRAARLATPWPRIVRLPDRDSAAYDVGSLPHKAGRLVDVEGAPVWASVSGEPPGHLVYGPSDLFEPGDYTASFRVWGGAVGSPPEQLTLDVVASGFDSSLTTEQTVSTPKGEFQSYALGFSLAHPGSVQFRVGTHGKGEAGIAGIEVERHGVQRADGRRPAVAKGLIGLVLAGLAVSGTRIWRSR